jgi:hypothetical protein
MFRKSLPIGTLVMILILALAAVGVGYSMWAENLVIDGTVKTGEVDVTFSGPWTAEYVHVDGTIELEPEVKGRYTKCEATGFDFDPDSDGYEGIDILVEGAYPSYLCYVWFDVTNIGTVPVHVSRPKPTAGNPDWVTVYACYDDEVQLHRGERAWCYLWIHFTNDDFVDENAEYRFHFDILAHQWNETP